MWVISILSGPQAGQAYPLNNGPNVLGREPGCDIILTSPGVSKQHAKLDVYDDKLIISDLNSRNGTFVNGVKVQSLRLQGGEKLSLHDVFFEISHMTPEQYRQLTLLSARSFAAQGVPANNTSAHMLHGHPEPYVLNQNAVPNNSRSPHFDQPAGEVDSEGSIKKTSILDLAKKYLDEVVLPGVYKLPEVMEFRWVLAGFMGAFIIFVTSLSAIPLMRILKFSIEKESQRRALTIARTLAKVNRAPLMQGLDSAVSIEIAQREPGVDKALIISNVDGNILAPASQAGKVPDLPFIHEARREGREAIKQIDDSTIGALVPIEFYNPETGSQAVTAYAAVIYNMGSLAVDDSRTLSLFIQTFFIAIIVGSILFFFLLKTIEFPLFSLNRQLDRALKENHNELKITYMFPVLQELVSNINSALSRMGDSAISHGMGNIQYDRGSELNNIVQLMGFGAIGITAHDLVIQAINPEFEMQTGMRSLDLNFQPVDKITDQALRLSIRDLIERAFQSPHQIATNELELSGQPFEIAIQAIHGTDQIAYYIITLLPQHAGGEI